MQVDELIAQYINLRLEKLKFVKQQNYEFAAQSRDEERKLSKQICQIINLDFIFESWTYCDTLIDDYCKKKFNSSIFEPNKCIVSINRNRNLNNLLD